MPNKTIKKLVFPDYKCEIMDDGDIFLVDHYAEHSIYIYKSQFERILGSYRGVFPDKKPEQNNVT